MWTHTHKQTHSPPLSRDRTLERRTAIAFVVAETQSGKVGHWSKRVLELGARLVLWE